MSPQSGLWPYPGHVQTQECGREFSTLHIIQTQQGHGPRFRRSGPSIASARGRLPHCSGAEAESLALKATQGVPGHFTVNERCSRMRNALQGADAGTVAEMRHSHRRAWLTELPRQQFKAAESMEGVAGLCPGPSPTPEWPLWRLLVPSQRFSK